MKKLPLVLFSLFLLTSCGPHRMSCGAKGICKSSENQILGQSKLNTLTAIVKIQ